MRETISKEICQALWLDQEVEWVMSSTVNKVGGMWIKDDVEVVIVNIYSPCDLGSKKRLWKKLVELKRSLCKVWCILGDFNCAKRCCEKQGECVVDVGNGEKGNSIISLETWSWKMHRLLGGSSLGFLKMSSKMVNYKTIVVFEMLALDEVVPSLSLLEPSSLLT
ncbi:hypothetical protein GmHk_14G040854 [Glycine max]|nr:hypothetical protein GmHk_14G040854 [Glycine max]